MRLGVCRKGTVRVAAKLLTFGLIGTAIVLGQSSPDWRKIGGEGVDLMLASPATGGVNRVWYAADGDTLYARTFSGKVFQTRDFDNWTPAANAPDPTPVLPATAVRQPEPGALIITASNSSSRMWALGRQLARSDDGGRSWTNLTAYKSQSVVGPDQLSVAISPSDPDQIVIGNAYGVWRSMDGGLSWAGLNESLPNLPVRRILSTPSGTAGARVIAEGLGALELPHGGNVWRPVAGIRLEEESRIPQYSDKVHAQVTAVGRSGDVIYIGSSDGRIWMSRDGGTQF